MNITPTKSIIIILVCLGILNVTFFSKMRENAILVENQSITSYDFPWKLANPYLMKDVILIEFVMQDSLVAIDKITGEIKWERELSEVNKVFFCKETNAFYVWDQFDIITKYTATTGDKLWQVRLELDVYADTFAMDYDKGLLCLKRKQKNIEIAQLEFLDDKSGDILKEAHIELYSMSMDSFFSAHNDWDSVYSFERLNVVFLKAANELYELEDALLRETKNYWIGIEKMDELNNAFRGRNFVNFYRKEKSGAKKTMVKQFDDTQVSEFIFSPNFFISKQYLYSTKYLSREKIYSILNSGMVYTSDTDFFIASDWYKLYLIDAETEEINELGGFRRISDVLADSTYCYVLDKNIIVSEFDYNLKMHVIPLNYTRQ